MQLTKTIKFKEYDTEVQIIVTDDARKALNRLYKKYNTGMVYKDTIAGYMLTVSMNMYHLILDTRFLTYNTILHELFHLTYGMTYDRNIFEEEPRAWVQGLLGQEIFNFLKSKNITVE